jgi:4,5-DOPA dioxygenase extradiol
MKPSQWNLTMNRRIFIGGVLRGIMTSFILKETQAKAVRMPTIFIGHGSPMNAIKKNSFTDFLNHFPKDLPGPVAILAISAHWETRGSKVLKTEKPKTIHDFGGFPAPLFQVQYPAPGSLKLADRVVELAKLHHVETDSSWGLDHGTWSVLKHMYPNADIPVVQLSLNQNMTFEEHMSLACELKPLRDEGVLILGSGNITHNLRRVTWEENAKPVDWAVEFDILIKDALLNRDTNVLLGKAPKNESLWKMAHPTLEHYLPLLYTYGASDEKEKVSFLFEGMQMGSLSMRSFMIG